MFGKPSSKVLSEMVDISSPKEARESACELTEHFESLEQRPAMVETKRATVLAANRAGAMTKKRGLSTKERREMRLVQRIFKSAAKKMKLPKR